MKKLGQRLLSGALACILSASFLPGNPAEAAETESVGTQTPGLGDISMEWNRDIYNGVSLGHSVSKNQDGLQQSYTVTYDPNTTEVKPVVSYGSYVMGGDIMSDMIHEEEANGSKVVFAINGDIYDAGNGVSSGLMIRDGVLISTAITPNAIGFKADGSVVSGNSSLNVTATPNGGSEIPITQVNKERKLDASGVYLLTEQFSKTTSSTQPGVEVVMDVTATDYQGLTVGGTISATVSSVNQIEANPDKNNTPIGNGQIVLCTNSSSSYYNELSSLQAGQSMSVSVGNASDEVDWTQVVQAIGVFHTLKKDGVEMPGLRDDLDINPHTSLGIKPDGSVVLFQCDGRQAGFAAGTTLADTMDYLESLGCETIYNLDGGGSSTITATLSGETSSTILNRPSDGSERANCNALIFVANAAPDESKELLHVYPDIEEGYGNKIMVLENGKLNFNVGATDGNYCYKDIAGTQLSYEAQGGIGSISEDGVLTAAAGSHNGKIVVSTQDGSATGEIDVHVVDAITKLTANCSILSVAPGKTTQIAFTAEYNGSPVVLTSEALSFQLSDESLGSISPDGTFAASENQGTGELQISYKDYTLTLPVEIGKLPVSLNDFEQSFEDQNWMWRYFNGEDHSRGGSAKMSINYDERYVKTGDGSLRVDYDFATNPITSTVVCECGPIEPLTMEGEPKAIGCWIYGDGNGEWVRIQLAPSAYAGDVYVNWKGWQYIENEIPSTAAFPYQLKFGVRILGTTKIANGKKGTVYVDGLRAVYDFKNDDVLAPELVPGSQLTPADGTVDVSNEPDISITVYDPEADGQPYTGINTDRTKLWINGKVMSLSAIQQEVQSDGSVKITFHPGALTMLRPGLNKIKYRVEDNAGNKFFKTWSFTVAGYAVNLEESYPSGEKAAAGSTFHYIINANDYKNFEEFQLDLSFNPTYVTLVNASYDGRLTASVNEVDSENGSVKYALTGMSGLQLDTNSPLVDLEFKTGSEASGQTGIIVNKAVVRQTGEITGTDLVLDGYDKEVALKYTLSWAGSTVGGTTTLKLADDSGNPVSGLGFKVTKDNNPVEFTEVTGADGTLTTDFFANNPVGTEFNVWVVDNDGALSNKQKITVFDSLGTDDPDKVTITTGENPSTSVGISWETNLNVSEGNLIIGKTSDLAGDDTINLPATGKSILTSLNGNNRNYKSWGVRATALDPDCTYYYKVGHEGHYSDLKSFTTAPADGDVTLSFYGDIQGAYNQFPNAITALKSLYPDIDMNIQAGDVSDDSQSYSDWVNAYSGFGDYLNTEIWAPTIGNHDSANDAQAFTSYFYGPDNGTYSTPRNYWFTVGNIIFYNFDTESTYGYDPDFSGQISHMKEVFSASEKDYKVVLMHRSAYPLNYDEADVRNLHTEFEKAGVCLVLSGHDHIYNRTEMYRGEKAPGTGVPYVVGGCSSGAKYYDADSNGRPWQDVVYDDNNPVFSVLKLRDGIFSLEAYALENGEPRKIDEMTIAKRESEKKPDNNNTDNDDHSSNSQKDSSAITNEDGSVTTTVTDPLTGAVTTTTKRTDGTVIAVEAKKDGSVIKTVKTPSGIKSQSTTTAEGSTSTTVDVPDNAVKNGKVALPVFSQPSQAAISAPEIRIALPTAAQPVQVELPVEHMTPSTVAILVTDSGDEEIIKASAQTGNGLAVALTGTQTIKIVNNTKSFSDISSTVWSADAVSFVTSRELFNGTGENTFSPDQEMNRAMLMTVLYRFAGGADSGDGETWYSNACSWAVEHSISDGSNLDGNITREQLATILYRYSGSKSVPNSTGSYQDNGQISGFAQDAMSWAVSNGVLTGKPGSVLDPLGNATRQEVAAILMRFVNQSVK